MASHETGWGAAEGTIDLDGLMAALERGPFPVEPLKSVLGALRMTQAHRTSPTLPDALSSFVAEQLDDAGLLDLADDAPARLRPDARSGQVRLDIKGPASTRRACGPCGAWSRPSTAPFMPSAASAEDPRPRSPSSTCSRTSSSAPSPVRPPASTPAPPGTATAASGRCAGPWPLASGRYASPTVSSAASASTSRPAWRPSPSAPWSQTSSRPASGAGTAAPAAPPGRAASSGPPGSRAARPWCSPPWRSPRRPVSTRRGCRPPTSTGVPSSPGAPPAPPWQPSTSRAPASAPRTSSPPWARPSTPTTGASTP